MNARHFAPLALIAPLALGCIDMEKEAATAVVQSALGSTKKQSTARQAAETAKEDCSMTAEEAANEAAAAPVVGLYPSSCVTKKASGASLHAEYDGCTGAFGYADINGGLDATFEVTGECQRRADVSDSGDLSNHGRMYDYDAVADVVVRPGARDIDWSDRWSGTTELEQDIEQRGRWQIVYGVHSGCYDWRGSAEGSFDGTPYALSLSDLRICEEECPSSGTLVATWNDELELSAEFDGSNIAKVNSWSGRTFEVEMVCAPAGTP